MVKNVLIVLLVVAVGWLGAVNYLSTSDVRFAGITHLSGLEVGSDGFSYGAPCTATSTSGTVVPLRAIDIDTENCIDVTLNVSSGTLSFPASSTISFIPTAGQTKTLFIRNATTTAATTLTISGGTGVILKRTSGTSTAPIVYGDTDGKNYAKIDLIRLANRDIVALMSVYSD